MIFLIVLAFMTTIYSGADNSGIVVGTESCHIGVETHGNVGFFAECYIPDNSPHVTINTPCMEEDGNPNGKPCIWKDPYTGDITVVDSSEYRNQGVNHG